MSVGVLEHITGRNLKQGNEEVGKGAGRVLQVMARQVSFRLHRGLVSWIGEG